jgi:hypothetical protein
MEHFLVCGNPSCRFVLDLTEVRNPQRVAETLFRECPECGSQWSFTCPFCAEPLSVMWHGHHPFCGHCHRQFHTPAAA